MVRRVLLTIPVAAIFLATSVIFLAARAPRTWAPNWSSPTTVARGAGANEYGAVPRGPGRWDLLWVDDDAGALVATPTGFRPRTGASTMLDRGDVLEPTLLRVGAYELGVWVHNHNGSTDLMQAARSAGSPWHVHTLLASPQPIEHPYLFADHGHAGLVFSWQRYGNFDIFWSSLSLDGRRISAWRRLTSSQYYGFYPRAAATGSGGIVVLHLESCCKQQSWNMELDRYDRTGHHAGPTVILQQINASQGSVGGSGWGEDVLVGSSGTIWGAFSGNDGAWVFEADRNGRILRPPTLVDRSSGPPSALSLAVGREGGFLFWTQSFDLGAYLDSQRFGRRLELLDKPQRVVYESAEQTNPHAAILRGKAEVIWQAIPPGLRSRFEVSFFRRAAAPSLAQRLGLGLGDPWEEALILAVSSIGVAAITTMGNILTIFGFVLLGLLVLRLLRPVPGRWVIYAALLSLSLYLTFVAPGGPILFLATMPSMGLKAVPFGVIAAVGALAFTGWMGLVALRRIDDPYRAGLMVVLGVYFFAFLEAMVFVQQRLGYI